jgi:hypothetical protein
MSKLISTYGYFAWFLSLQLATLLSATAIWVGSKWSLSDAGAPAEEYEPPPGPPELFKSSSTGHEEEGGRAAGLRKHTLSKKSTRKLDVLSMIMIGGESQVVPVREADKKIVRLSGVQDEFMRSRVGDSNFYLWDRNGTVGQRLAWRLAMVNNTPSRRNKEFLHRRRNDPTSYFGQRQQKKAGGGAGGGAGGLGGGGGGGGGGAAGRQAGVLPW